jgi:hypothetical protein
MNGIDPRQLRGQLRIDGSRGMFPACAQGTPMIELRNRVVEVTRLGGPDGLKVVDAPLPMAGPGEVRVRVPGTTP